jgi:hypothetical protein
MSYLLFVNPFNHTHAKKNGMKNTLAFTIFETVYKGVVDFGERWHIICDYNGDFYATKSNRCKPGYISKKKGL